MLTVREGQQLAIPVQLGLARINCYDVYHLSYATDYRPSVTVFQTDET